MHSTHTHTGDSQQRDLTPPWQTHLADAGMVLLLLLLLFHFLLVAPTSVFEFDQVSTLFLSSVHSWHAYVAGLAIDSQPPFTHLVTRIGLTLPLPLLRSITLRIPSFIGIATASIALFLVFRRRAAPLAGLCAAAYFTASRGADFMLSIRPYAWLMACAALSVCLYDSYRIRRSDGERAPFAPLVVLIVFSCTVHTLAIIYVLAPIISGELLGFVRERRVDRRLLLAVGLASSAFAVDVLLAMRVRAATAAQIPLSGRVPNLPSVEKLREFLAWPIERHWQVALFAAIGVLTLALQARRVRVNRSASSAALLRLHTGRLDSRSTLCPVVAALSLYAAAMTTFVLGVVNHYFFTRYAAPVYVAGALVLGSALAAAPWRRYAPATAGLAAVLLLLPLPKLSQSVRMRNDEPFKGGLSALFAHGDVIASPLVAPTIWWYSTPQQRSRLRVVTDESHSVLLPDAIPEATLRNYAKAGILPLPLTPYDIYRPGPEVYLVQSIASGDSWLPAALAQRGFTCEPARDFTMPFYILLRCAHAHTVAPSR